MLTLISVSRSCCNLESGDGGVQPESGGRQCEQTNDGSASKVMRQPCRQPDGTEKSVSVHVEVKKEPCVLILCPQNGAYSEW